MQKRVQGQPKRNPMPCRRHTDGDWIGHGSGDVGGEKVERVARPCRTRDLDKGSPLRGGFQMPLTRRDECRGKLCNIVQGLAISLRSSAVGMA